MILDFSKIFALLLLAPTAVELQGAAKCEAKDLVQGTLVTECVAYSNAAKALVGAKVCKTPADVDFTLCDNDKDVTKNAVCLKDACNKKDGIEDTCMDGCFKIPSVGAKEKRKREADGKADNDQKKCFEDCAKCSDNTTGKTSCEVLSNEATAMIEADVCVDRPKFEQCRVDTELTGGPSIIPSCLGCTPKQDINSPGCVEKCFKKAYDRETASQQIRMRRDEVKDQSDKECYEACSKCTDNSIQPTCVLLRNEATEMNKVCEAKVLITQCKVTAQPPTDMPTCLKDQCKAAKKGFEFTSDNCLDECFKKRTQPQKSRRDVDAEDTACYAGCSEKITTTATTATTTTTTAAKDKKPSGVDPAVVPPVVPSNNQTLGNNSTAAPKPNAPNSNNSTGADAAFHVGQTLSFARMIFTALALVMAVQVIAA